MHYRDAVGHGERLLLVVGHQNGRDTVVTLKPLHLDLHVETQILVERPERLVQHQDFGIDRKAARKRDALLLPARKLARQPFRVLPHMYEIEHLFHTGRNPIARPVMSLEPIGYVLANGHVRKQRIALENDTDTTAIGRQVIDALVVEQDTAPGFGG